MKKTILLSIIISAGLFLTLNGCSLWEKSPAEELQERIIEQTEETTDEITLEGTIAQKDISLEEDGTHLLQTADRKTIPVQSKVVSLNTYLGKAVKIKGVKNKKDIIDILEIAEIQSETSIKKVQDKNFGIGFAYSSKIDLKNKNKELLFFRKDQDEPELFLKITQKNNYSPQGDVMALTENVEAFRLDQDNENIIISFKLPTAPEKDFIVLTYYADTQKSLENKGLFYDILHSIYLIEEEQEEPETITNGPECGGPENIICEEEGYYCEVQSPEDGAVGTCQKIEADKPLEGEDLETAEEPEDISLESEDPTENSEPNATDELTETDLSDMNLVKKHIKSELSNLIKNDPELDLENLELKLLEFSDPNIVSAVYGDEETIRRITWTYDVSPEKTVSLEQSAYFVPGETQDWVLEDGENIQAGKAKTILKADQEEAIELPENSRLYQNSRFSFSAYYPASWYYAGLGSGDDFVYRVGFGTEPIADGNAVVNIDIVEKDNQSAISDGIQKTVERDEETVFIVHGQTDYKEVIEQIANSLKSEEEEE